MWTGQWFVYEQTPDGEKRKKREKVVGACSELTKGQAQELLDELIRGSSNSSPKQLENITVAEFGKRYRELKNPHWTAHWQTVMKSLWLRHIDPQLGAVRLRDLKRERIQLHINDMGAKSISFSIIHKVRTHLKAMLDEAIEADVITKNPARLLDLPKCKKNPRLFLSEEQCLMLLTVAKKRSHLILRLALTLGLRPSEIFALRADDIFPGSLRIDESYVQGLIGDPKTLHSKGFVTLPPSLEAELRAFVSARNIQENAFLFTYRNGRPLRSGNYVRRQLRSLGKSVGIQPLTFQMLRRTFATHVQRHSTLKDLQGAMRHARPDMTADVYVQELPEGVKKAVTDWDLRLSSLGSARIN